MVVDVMPYPPGVLKQLEPIVRQSMSDWATDHFFINEVGAVRPGVYDLSWTPYWREPLDALSDPEVRLMNLVACAQSGKTQLGSIFVAYTAKFQPANLLYVRPALDDVVEAFRDRFKTMAEANLRDLIPNADYCTLSKNPAIALSTMTIYGAAASIPRQLTSRTCLKTWFDETDSGGEDDNSLGNVLDLLDERQMAGSSLQSLTLGSSTPKRETGSNWQAYLKSDCRKYNEPCPECGVYQPLVFRPRMVTVDGERDPDLILENNLARYICEGCGCEIHPEHQNWMADRGVWVPKTKKIIEKLDLDDAAMVEAAKTITKKDERWTPRMEGEEPRGNHRGYQVWRANTKFEQCTWSHIMARWWTVQPTRDSMRLQVFVNNWLAEPFTEAKDPANKELLKTRIGVYPAKRVPGRVKIVLGAVDVQPDCVYYLFRGFGAEQQSWLIEYGRIEVYNENFYDAFEKVYEKGMRLGWVYGDLDDNLHMRCYAMAIDSGYQAGEVYEFCRRSNCIAVKGKDIADWPVKPATVEGKKNPDPLTLWHINTKVTKDRLQKLIKSAPGQPGEFNLHADTTDEYLDHLVAEQLRGRKSNKKIKTWQVKTANAANHYLDCESYIQGLIYALEYEQEVSVWTIRADESPAGTFRPSNFAKPAAEPVKAEPPPPPKKKTKRRAKKSNWMSGGQPKR